jgi:hypothetical protein
MKRSVHAVNTSSRKGTKERTMGRHIAGTSG